MRLWAISKTSRGYIVRWFTPTTAGAQIWIQYRADTLKEARNYVKSHGGTV